MNQQIKERIRKIQNGEVPEGYKKTKVGIVPSEWEIKKIKNVLTQTERPIDMKDDWDYQLVTVRRGFNGIDSRGIFKGLNILVKNQFEVKTNDFIISKRQISHGACGVLPENLDGSIVSNEYNVFTAPDGTDINFFNIFMQVPRNKNLFFLMSDGVHIEKMLFKTKDWCNQKLPLPPLHEQQKIAEILTTQDKVIELKEKLIAEKEQQKKYLMQNLLTGKKRLKGFSSEWEKVKLLKHLLPASKEAVDDTSKYRKITVKLNFKGIDFANLNREMADTRPFYIRSVGEIIVGKQNYFNGSIAIVSEKFNGCICSNAIMSFNIKNANTKFLYEYLSQRDFIEKRSHLANGTGQKELSEKEFLDFVISLPPLDEQNAIAEILSTADREIELLKADSAEEKQKKKALMQLLLTGIARV